MFPTILQASLYTNNVVLIFGALLLASLGFWYYSLQKKNPNLDFGPLIATAMVSKHETFFMLVIFAEYIFAAIIASTVHGARPDEVEMSPLGRIGMHLIISIVGTIAQFTLARDVAVQFIKQGSGERVGNLYVLIVITVVAFFVPYANLMLIASGNGESLAFDIWVYSMNPFVSESTLQAKFIQLGYPPNYQPWQNLSNAMHVTIVSSFLVHYLLTTIEAARTMSSPQRRKILMDRVLAEQKMPEEEKKKEEGKKTPEGVATKSPMRGEEDKVTQIVPNASFLLKRLGYSDNTKIGHLANDIQKKILASGEQDSLRLSYRMAQLVARAKTIDASADTDKKAQKDQLLVDIRKFIAGDDKDDKGATLNVDKRGLKITIKN